MLVMSLDHTSSCSLRGSLRCISEYCAAMNLEYRDGVSQQCVVCLASDAEITQSIDFSRDNIDRFGR